MKLYIIKKILPLIVLLNVITSCAYVDEGKSIDKPIDPIGPIEPINQECDTIKRIVFEEDIWPIIQNNCVECHFSDNNHYPLLSTTKDFLEVEGNSDIIYNIINNITIPRPACPKLDECNIKKYNKYFLTKGCDKEVTYSKTIKFRIQSKCASCHNFAPYKGGVNLSTYNEVLKYVEDGSLLGSLRHTEGFDAMPLNKITNLPFKIVDDPCYINDIELWIKNGAPNN